MKVGKTGEEVELAHLFFIETLLFCKLNIRDILNLKCIMLSFQAVFGLDINMPKLKLVQLGNSREVEDLVTMLGYKNINLPIDCNILLFN